MLRPGRAPRKLVFQQSRLVLFVNVAIQVRWSQLNRYVAPGCDPDANGRYSKLKARTALGCHHAHRLLAAAHSTIFRRGFFVIRQPHFLKQLGDVGRDKRAEPLSLKPPLKHTSSLPGPPRPRSPPDEVGEDCPRLVETAAGGVVIHI